MAYRAVKKEMLSFTYQGSNIPNVNFRRLTHPKDDLGSMIDIWLNQPIVHIS